MYNLICRCRRQLVPLVMLLLCKSVCTFICTTCCLLSCCIDN